MAEKEKDGSFWFDMGTLVTLRKHYKRCIEDFTIGLGFQEAALPVFGFEEDNDYTLHAVRYSVVLSPGGSPPLLPTPGSPPCYTRGARFPSTVRGAPVQRKGRPA